MSDTAKLSKPQRRILETAVRDGKSEVGGRNMPAVDRLKKAGLITVDWSLVAAGIGNRWRGTVWPTAAGRAAVDSEVPAQP